MVIASAGQIASHSARLGLARGERAENIMRSRRLFISHAPANGFNGPLASQLRRPSTFELDKQDCSNLKTVVLT
jgi:hypothetical protein